MHTFNSTQINNVYEAEMKALLLEHWRSSGKITAADTIVNEFTFYGLNRRIDLAILKEDELIGVEIKSTADTLERLSGQLKEYSEFFDKIYIFVCEKYEEKCLSLLNSEHELLVLKKNKIKTVKRGKKSLIKHKINYIKMMRANELTQLLREFHDKKELAGRKQLENLALNLSKSQLRKSSFCFLRKRFSSSSRDFWKKINIGVTVDQVQSLHRNNFNLKNRLRKDSVSNSIRNGSWKLNNKI